MAVLRTSGNLKKKHPDAPEAALCLRAIVDVNLPKFLAPDVPLFKGIVGDLFPGVELEEVDYENSEYINGSHVISVTQFDNFKSFFGFKIFNPFCSLDL